jgi:hypothetical protein
VWPSSYLSSGHLLISGPRGVSAVPFDPARPQATIAPTPVVEDVYSSPNLNFSWISASETGTLVYVPGDPSLATLAWADRSGGVTPLSGKPSRFLDQAISPDGTRIVLFVDGSLWTMDLRRGTRSRLTAVDGGVRRFANWSRDGTRIFFASNESGEWEMYSVPSAGGRATQLLARPGMQMPLSEAPDGTLLFGERFTGAGSDLLLLAPGGQVSTFVASGFANVGGQFSPDGTLIAYTSDETGREEVYVRPVAKPDQVIAVSTEGGRGPKWSADGNEIVYRRGDAFVSAGVSAKGALSVGDSRTLFELRTGAPTNTQYAGYDVSPDGRRFLVALPDPSAIPTRINVVQNWFHELKAKVPTR